MAWLGSDPQPGLIEVELVDAQGKRWRFVDKEPIFGGDLRADSRYPVDLLVECTEVGRRQSDEGERVMISTAAPWGIESQDGTNLFEVTPDQLVEGA